MKITTHAWSMTGMSPSVTAPTLWVRAHEVEHRIAELERERDEARRLCENLHRLALDDGNAPAPLPWEEGE